MIDFLGAWYRRHFTNPQAALLAVFLLLCVLVLWLAGKLLMPLLVALVLAYLLEAPVTRVQALPRMGRLPSVCFIFSLFIVFLVLLVLVLYPVLSREISDFISGLPKMIDAGQALLLGLPERYPSIFSEDTVREIAGSLRYEITTFTQNILLGSVSSIPVLVTVLVYLFLVPIVIFFLLADKDRIMAWCGSFLPTERPLLNQVWKETDAQIGNYLRGKFFEIVIVGVSGYIVFLLFGLNYAPLLAILVGLSVMIPYVGAVVVTLPIIFVGYTQWGLGSTLYWLLGCYFLLQFLDGNVLVPVLFSEAVNLHPIAIIAAILLFGGMWGFWGVFFAIPLAILIKAILGAWPSVAKGPGLPGQPATTG